MNARKSVFSLIAILLIALAGCAKAPGSGVSVTGTYTPPPSFEPDANTNIKHFSSDEDLRAFLNSATSEAPVGIAYGRAGGVMMAESADVGMKTTSAVAPTPAFSQTNNQVASVDEADTTKTDGHYIYTITGNTVFIVKAGENASVVKTIAFNNTPQGLFIDGDHLAVFGNFYDFDYFKSIDYVPRNGMTFFTVYDISDIQTPRLIKDYKFEGNYFQARIYNDNVYFVVISTPSPQYPRPIIMVDGVKQTMPASDIAYFPIPYNNVQYVTVHALNLASPSDVNSQSIAVQWGEQMYMSEKNIYLTYTENINQWDIRQKIAMNLLEPQLTASDKALIEKIKAVDNDVLSQSEKDNKIYQIYNTYEQYMPDSQRQDFEKQVDDQVQKEMDKYTSLSYTVIARLSVDNGNVQVEATGKVPGTIQNQFSMDEYNNVLRIATTIQPQWRIQPLGIADDARENAKIMPPRPIEQKSTNNVYTLDMNLNIIGKLEDIDPGLNIQSTRFVGDKLYIDTFRQVDPFSVIDLSDPANPKLLGQLKIPGFVSYLHPYDENTLIGIGRDATATGSQQGLKISVFDVSDVQNPKVLASFVTNEQYAQSTAQWEHKAFLFDKDKELLVIPAYSYSYNAYNSGHQDYNGAMVFRVNKNEVTLRGIIDHSNGNQNYGPMVERSLFIDDLLYTKSPNLLRVNRLSDLSSVKKVDLKPGTQGQYVIID